MVLSADWRKSTLSTENGCVEAAFIDGLVSVRDSKAPNGPILRFDPSVWSAFIKDIHEGRFDGPQRAGD
jgi:hypothetical protein